MTIDTGTRGEDEERTRKSSKTPPDSHRAQRKRFRLLDKTREAAGRGFGFFCALPPEPDREASTRVER